MARLHVGEPEQRLRRWSDMSQDILELITARLHIGDRVQASRVCKPWRAATLRMAASASAALASASYGSPCLLRLSDDCKTCTLTDPLRKESFTVGPLDLPQGVSVAGSNYGWLLLVGGTCFRSDVLFFDPLTRTTIKLPNFEFNSCSFGKFSTVDFLWPPTSSRCVVIASCSFPFDLNTAVFSFWRQGDESWTNAILNELNGFRAWKMKPVVFREKIHLLDDLGRLVIYDFNNQTLIGVIEEALFQHETDMHNLAVMNDKLLSVFADFIGGSVRIYELDESKRQWIKLDGVGESLLFATATNCVILKSSPGNSERVYAWKNGLLNIMPPS